MVGVPDYDMGELVHAVVSFREPCPSAAELDKYARDRLAGYKCPRTYEFTPRSPEGRRRQGPSITPTTKAS